MITIETVDEHNRQKVIDQLSRDVIRHVFAFYDLQYQLQRTMCLAAFERRKLAGYMLTYTGFESPSIVIEGTEEAARKLIEHAPRNHFLMHTPPELLPIVKAKYPKAKHYVESWMLVKQGQATFFPLSNVRKLVPEDAQQLATLLATRKERKNLSIDKYAEWLKEHPMYGLFVNGKLVSYAGSFVQTPQIWMIGGVYTDPHYRNRGYATASTSTITQEALNNAENAALLARADNASAIKAYTKIGYRKIGEKIWTDQGTGMRP